MTLLESGIRIRYRYMGIFFQLFGALSLPMVIKSSKLITWVRIVIVDYCSGVHLDAAVTALSVQSLKSLTVTLM